MNEGCGSLSSLKQPVFVLFELGNIIDVKLFIFLEFVSRSGKRTLFSNFSMSSPLTHTTFFNLNF